MVETWTRVFALLAAILACICWAILIYHAAKGRHKSRHKTRTTQGR